MGKRIRARGGSRWGSPRLRRALGLKRGRRAPDEPRMEPARAFPPAPKPRARNGGVIRAARPTGSEGEALLRVAAAAAGAHDLEQVLELAAEEARAAVGAASLSVSRWEREGRRLRTLVNVGELGPGEERYPSDESYSLEDDRAASRLLENGIAYFNAVDASGVDPFAAARLVRLGKESEVGVPIVVEGEAWGEVYATTASGQPRFRGDDVRFLEAVAGQLAVAIGRAELFSRVSRLAYEDALTGLANRRAVEERLSRAVARADERGGSLTVVLCDLDELKAINDSRGHDAGDRALRRVADALVGAAAARPGNLVARLAGDEFCVVMEGAGLGEARALAAMALDTLSSHPDDPLLISCGAALLGPDVATPTQLLRAADAALYRAKRNGGGQMLSAGARAWDAAPRGERRALRRDPRESLRDAVRELIARFEGPLASASALERVEAVAVAFAEIFNAAAWAVSFAPVPGDQIQTVSLADGRDRRLRGLHIDVDNDVYPADEYPATARLIRAGAGSFAVSAADPEADPAELAVLAAFKRTGVLAAAAADHDGTWLLEVYSDEDSAPLEDGRLEAGLLVRAAIPPRPAGRGGAGLLERRTRQLRLTSALAARLAAARDRDAMVSAAVEEVHAAMGGIGVSSARLLEDGSHVSQAGAGVFASPDMAGLVGAAGRGLLGRSMRDGRPVLVGDIRLEPDYFPTPVSPDTRSELDVPVTVEGAVWGGLSVQSAEVDAFDDDDVRLMVTVADLLGSAMRSARA